MRIILGAVLVFAGVTAHAFQLADHKHITEQAYGEFVKCFPKFATVPMDALVEGDLVEDLNLIEKELVFSHYYNPYKKLKMWREDSSGRIENLRPDLMLCRASAASLSRDEATELGHAIHHLQDMAVPPHVVPVEHSFWDGFESYKLTGDISSEWSCGQIATSASEDLAEILKETAVDTLDAVKAMDVEVVDKTTRTASHVDGTAFWVESNDDGFGDYGKLGNNFGQTEIDTDLGKFQVSDEAYADFKRQQMKAAVRATLRGLVWTLRPETSALSSSL